MLRFFQLRKRSSSQKHSNPSNDGPSASSFCLQNSCSPSAQFWRCALEEDVSTQDQGKDAWWWGRYRENQQSLFYVPEIIRIELTSHFDIENSRTCCCQKILAVAATTTYLSLKRLGRNCLCLPIDQLWLGWNCLCHWKNTSNDLILVQIPINVLGLAEVFIDLIIRHFGPLDSIVGQSTPLCSGIPRYHFQARLRLYAFELIMLSDGSDSTACTTYWVYGKSLSAGLCEVSSMDLAIS